jgi:hypothetical protein
MAITFVVEELVCLATIRPPLRSHDTDLRPYTVAVAGFALDILSHLSQLVLWRGYSPGLHEL